MASPERNHAYLKRVVGLGGIEVAGEVAEDFSEVVDGSWWDNGIDGLMRLMRIWLLGERTISRGSRLGHFSIRYKGYACRGRQR